MLRLKGLEGNKKLRVGTDTPKGKEGARPCVPTNDPHSWRERAGAGKVGAGGEIMQRDYRTLPDIP